MSDVYTTRQLAGIANTYFQPDQFLLDQFFPRTIISNQERLDIYTMTEGETVAEFVAPCVESNVLNPRGSTLLSITPAYIKEKINLGPCNFMERLEDEDLGGSLTPLRRREILYGRAMAEMDRRFQRREELMAADVLLNGTLTVSGAKYPATILDFQRDAGHTITLGGTNVWSNALSTPFKNLQTWSGLTLTKTGYAAQDFVMTPDAIALLMAHQDMVDMRSAFNGVTANSLPQMAPRLAARNLFFGNIGPYRIWQYDGQYVDKLGARQTVLPANTVIAVAKEPFMGTKAYGAIKDHRSLVATKRFQKMWYQEDPSAFWMQMQSAPVVFPINANASVAVTVA